MTRVFYSVRRLQRGEEAKRGRHALNLVPLMDVFTILIFFLLVHSSEFVMTDSRQMVSLPESVTDQLPRQTLIVTLTRSEILLEGMPVARIDAVLDGPEGAIEALERALRGRAAPDGTGKAKAGMRELTIMADKTIPFRLLRKVMLSCTRAGYERIALSVLQKPMRGG